MKPTEKELIKRSMKLERVCGIFLLSPPMISVILFVINLLTDEPGNLAALGNLSANWSGYYDTGGFTSAAPIYLGLMAIAGAILLKGTDNKQD